MTKKQRIYDAVYGYIELDDAEFALVTLPIFQRLHWIKQLGPLHTVFPSAQHSRFSHTIGVFHIVKKMIEHFENRADTHKYVFDKKRKEKDLLKFAALLHDIGHVPLSHIGEEVLKDTLEEDLAAELLSKAGDRTFDPFAKGKASWWNLFPEEKYHGGNTKLHERVSAEIVLHSKEIDAALSKVKGWKTKKRRQEAKEKIAKIIVGKDCLDVPTLLLHSELDADRLDYLLRDSFFTGVGYGKIDLDYIILRLAIFRDEANANAADLCIEFKGLHTVEHYILGRFFLQTQVIFNRKVRFMDLLFRDVMKYMVKHQNEGWSLMGLEEICDCVRGKSVENLHSVYSYTDAQVFSRMRTLHDELDRKEKENRATKEEAYINDCVKTIMGSKIPEPVFPTCQKLIDLRADEAYKSKVQKEANAIAKKVARELGIYRERVKANLVEQEVMKYKKSMAAKDGTEAGGNREAVRILYRSPEGKEERKHAARSNASILCDLADKALLILNVYYVAPKSEAEERVDSNRKAIEAAFNGFVTKKFPS